MPLCPIKFGSIKIDDISSLPACDIALLATPVGVREKYINEFSKRKIPLFTEKITALEEKYNQLVTKYSGPWPPYNFVDIRIMGKGR